MNTELTVHPTLENIEDVEAIVEASEEILLKPVDHVDNILCTEVSVEGNKYYVVGQCFD